MITNHSPVNNASRVAMKCTKLLSTITLIAESGSNFVELLKAGSNAYNFMLSKNKQDAILAGTLF